MSTTYLEAQRLLWSVAKTLAQCPERKAEEIPLVEAVGRITAKQYVSPRTTPTFDSSAMDGYAVAAAATEHASPKTPVLLRIVGCVVAGGEPTPAENCSGQDGVNSCIEIMTGARMPSNTSGNSEYNAVVKLEDAPVVDVVAPDGSYRCIEVTKPVKRHSHIRLAGSDCQKDDLVLDSQTTVRPHHIMALASLGIKSVAVTRKLRVGVWSTGHELSTNMDGPDQSAQIEDANGPFLEALLKDLGAHVDFLGIIDDCTSSFKSSLSDALHARHYDALISTGAVSRGRLDFIPAAIKSMQATIQFHGVAMRPGHPVLFATLPPISREGHTSHRPMQGSTAFFGLPGNPIATAACARFLVMPYLRSLHGIQQETAVKARLQPAGRHQGNVRVNSLAHLDCFQHGHLFLNENGHWVVEPSSDQSPAKMRPFSAANCWCHIPSNSDGASPEFVDCFCL